MEENNTRVSNGMRIRYYEENGLMVSTKIYSNGVKNVKLVVDKNNKRWRLVEPVTGITINEGGDGINNLEVLLRHAKKALKNYLDIYFEKETREPKGSRD